MIKMLTRMIGGLSPDVRAGWPTRFSTRLNTPPMFSENLLLRRLARHADSQFGRDHYLPRDPHPG